MTKQYGISSGLMTLNLHQLIDAHLKFLNEAAATRDGTQEPEAALNLIF